MSILALLAAVAASPAPATPPEKVLAPAEIVAAAPAAEWLQIAASDLLVMDLAPDAAQRPRRVVIQLLPAPFSQGWVSNVRKLAAVHWWDGTSINRAQDNYVVQWGDPDGEDKAKAKALPKGLGLVAQSEYTVGDIEVNGAPGTAEIVPPAMAEDTAAYAVALAASVASGDWIDDTPADLGEPPWWSRDSYSQGVQFHKGWPIASRVMGIPMAGRPKELSGPRYWPVHCYGTVGVGRNEPPDTGTGAELYAVIGHAPRQLDRNIAIVGRVIEGMEHLSTLPRGTGDLGFYRTAAERTPIRSVRLGTEVADLPAFEYLGTESESFARYADARANRRDAFYIQPAGGVDICNVPVPVRRRK